MPSQISPGHCLGKVAQPKIRKFALGKLELMVHVSWRCPDLWTDVVNAMKDALDANAHPWLRPAPRSTCSRQLWANLFLEVRRRHQQRADDDRAKQAAFLALDVTRSGWRSGGCREGDRGDAGGREDSAGRCVAGGDGVEGIERIEAGARMLGRMGGRLEVRVPDVVSGMRSVPGVLRGVTAHPFFDPASAYGDGHDGELEVKRGEAVELESGRVYHHERVRVEIGGEGEYGTRCSRC